MRPARPCRDAVPQDYGSYTRRDHEVWARMSEAFAEFHGRHKNRIYAPYLRELDALRLSAKRIPRIEELNERLARIGWSAACVEGYAAPRIYAAMSDAKILGVARRIRSREQLAYAPVPDLIHDVFGHLPLLMDPEYRAFLGAWDAAARTIGGNAERRFSFWALEFGLLGTPEKNRVVGAGLLSSIAECERLFGGQTPVRPFGVGAARTDFKLADFQEQLFACPSLGQYTEAVAAYAAKRP